MKIRPGPERFREQERFRGGFSAFVAGGSYRCRGEPHGPEEVEGVTDPERRRLGGIRPASASGPAAAAGGR